MADFVTTDHDRCKSLEKGDFSKQVDVQVAPSYDGEYLEEFRETASLKQGLHQRHIQMIALAGTIGTGLFLSSGRAIANGGPLGALLGYTLIGLLVMAPVFSVAEMSTLVPLSGGIIRHAEYFVDPALSFADGWNTVYSALVSVPAEIVAAAVIVDFWVSINNAVWITVFGVLLLLSNVILVRIYGELEFSFAILKILLILGLNLMALVLVCGGGPNHHVYGVEFWRNPGPLVQYLHIPGSLGRFLGFYTTLINAVYAYSGAEVISVAAAETRSPRHAIPSAAKRVFLRIALFYILSIFMVGLLVPSNDPHLLSSTGTASQSPFVTAASRAGIRAIPSIINAVVLTSAWSAGNSTILTASRTLYGLAVTHRAPRFFMRTSRLGVPWIAVTFLCAFLPLGYMTLNHTAAEVFTWLQSLVASATLVHWSVICGVYLRFFYALRVQGIPRSRLPWHSFGQPYLAWSGLMGCSLLLLTNGYTVFIRGQWSAQTFVSAYFNIPLSAVLYGGYKWLGKTRVLPLSEVPVRRYVEFAERTPEQEPELKKGWRRVEMLWS